MIERIACVIAAIWLAVMAWALLSPADAPEPFPPFKPWRIQHETVPLGGRE